MNSIVDQCKDTLIKDTNETNGIQILSIFFQMKDLLSVCDETIIKNIIYILLLIGWRNYPLYFNILNEFGVSYYIEKESTKPSQVLIEGYKSNFYPMFSDILLFFYISFLSHSQKKDLYSLITNNIMKKFIIIQIYLYFIEYCYPYLYHYSSHFYYWTMGLH